MRPIIILSAPSSCGKNVIAAALLKRLPNLARVLTATTRAQRPNEKDGQDYYFWTQEQFAEHIARGQMAEWAKVHNHLYGIPNEAIEQIINQDKTPLLVIDVQGEQTIKKTWPNTLSIFIEPESLEVMEIWLQRRGKNTPTDITIRLQSAAKELQAAKKYDHIIINRDGQLDQTINQVEQIITAAMDKQEKTR